MQQYPYGSYPPPQRPPAPPSTTPWLAIIGGILVVLFFIGGLGALAAYTLRVKGSGLGAAVDAGATWSDSDAPIPVTSRDPVWGERGAPITVVFFGDLQDPASATLQSSLESLQVYYGPSILRIVWKNQPTSTHPQARAAAEAAMGVFALKGSDAFWRFQKDSLTNAELLSPALFATWAARDGVNAKRFQDGTSRHEWAPKVDEDIKLGTALGVTLAPVVYVNGIGLSGPAISTLQSVIDTELPKARAMITSGVSAERVYVEQTKINTRAPAVLPDAAAGDDADAGGSSSISGAKLYYVPIGTSPIRGYPSALVTIVEFADFQCPFCKRAEATLTALMAKYGTKLRIVWKNNPLPFHTRAVAAAEAAMEVFDERGSSAFWSMHDDLYAEQSTGFDEATLLRLARDHKANEIAVRLAILSNSHKIQIERDETLGKSVGAMGTPTFFINGRQLAGAQPQSAFETVIDEELKKADDRVARGTRPANVYDVIMGEVLGGY